MHAAPFRTRRSEHARRKYRRRGASPCCPRSSKKAEEGRAMEGTGRGRFILRRKELQDEEEGSSGSVEEGGHAATAASATAAQPCSTLPPFSPAAPAPEIRGHRGRGRGMYSEHAVRTRSSSSSAPRRAAIRVRAEGRGDGKAAEGSRRTRSGRQVCSRCSGATPFSRPLHASNTCCAFRPATRNERLKRQQRSVTRSLSVRWRRRRQHSNMLATEQQEKTRNKHTPPSCHA